MDRELCRDSLGFVFALRQFLNRKITKTLSALIFALIFNGRYNVS